MKGLKRLTQEEFLAEVKQVQAQLATQSAKLAELVRHVGAAPDFSPVVMKEAEALLATLEEQDTHKLVKRVHTLNKARGVSFYDEKKEELLAGELKLDRRSDMAAE